MEIIQVIPRIVPTDASIIGYTPLQGEVDYRPILLRILDSRDVLLPPTPEFDPFYCADLCARHFKDTPISILISGRRFDLSGTRHGRGGGWYDRFLASVPPEWIRVGVMPLASISAIRLTRNAWDQPVDWLLACDGPEGARTWQAFETHARSQPEQLFPDPG